MKQLAFGVAAALLLPGAAAADHEPLSTGAFKVTKQVVVPGTPEEIFDAFTGDIIGWWDHTFSENPSRLFIEPRVGGGFWELYDDQGNGIRHAVVIGCDRPSMLRMEGPLGFAGYALSMVHTFDFKALDEGRTELTVTVRGTGEMQEGWAAAVDGVWTHFLVERFKPWVEAGKHRE